MTHQRAGHDLFYKAIDFDDLFNMPIPLSQCVQKRDVLHHNGRPLLDGWQVPNQRHFEVALDEVKRYGVAGRFGAIVARVGGCVILQVKRSFCQAGCAAGFRGTFQRMSRQLRGGDGGGPSAGTELRRDGKGEGDIAQQPAK